MWKYRSATINQLEEKIKVLQDSIDSLKTLFTQVLERVNLVNEENSYLRSVVIQNHLKLPLLQNEQNQDQILAYQSIGQQNRLMPPINSLANQINQQTTNSMSNFDEMLNAGMMQSFANPFQMQIGTNNNGLRIGTQLPLPSNPNPAFK